MVKADVIAAIATGAGRAAIGVVRLSGPSLQNHISGLLGSAVPPRVATRRGFLDAAGNPIDSGLALFFPGPRSFTGEDVLELHGHGGPAVLRLLLRRCLELGARLADPGEFSRRALFNDKLDLAQAESVADLIDAGSEAAARAALRSLRGEFSAEIQGIVADLIEFRALVEGSIDFPEEDIEILEQARARDRIQALGQRLARLTERAKSGRLLRDGAVAVLIGRPNVGKSSLLNRLAQEDIAIVTEVPGTTRDAIRTDLVLDGVPVHVIDTAGLRHSEDQVERLGIERTWAAIESADTALLIADAEHGIGVEEQSILARIPDKTHRVLVTNKIDLIGLAPSSTTQAGCTLVQVSAKTGAGIELLKDAILQSVGWIPEHAGTFFLARERHIRCLRAASEQLRRANEVYDQLELLAEELRLAQESLGEITGKYASDDLLGEIFSRFCIGK